MPALPSRITGGTPALKRIVILGMLMLCTVFSSAQAETGTYGKTRTTVRVRASASTSAAILDNITPDACVYMLDTLQSGSYTFAEVKYRAYSGAIASGWVCVKAGSTIYIDPLTASQAKASFSVSGGSLPAARVGTFKTIGTAASASSSSSSSSSSSGSDAVKQLQTQLKKLGYYSGSITGNIGPKTEAAIKAFQKAKGLTVTGTADAATLAAVSSAVSGSSSSSSSSSSSGTVYNVEWFANKTGFYNKIGLAAGGQARLTDLTTGKSLNIYILSTGNHADVEPLTASDTATLCAIFGVSSPEDISYARRPMLVKVGSYEMVCSIYGVPHGAQKITTNDYPGQFCLHFLGSRTHGSDSVDADHQAAISKAASIMKNKGYTVVTAAPSL